jgi:NADH-quinone oxidoreductase subunit L
MNGLIGLGILILPLLSSIWVALGNVRVKAAHRITIGGVGLSFLLSLYAGYRIFFSGMSPVEFVFYHWQLSDALTFSISMYLDQLTALLLIVVNFVSLMVHIYSVVYMRGDPGYQRFFSYMSLFTFSMLTLLSARNFLQLFFAWEGVGLVSYLLIGFWYKRGAANNASLKAFVVNRVGDFSFILGIGLIWKYFGTLDYQTIFQLIPHVANQTFTLMPGIQCSVITMICLLLFVGAMGKSAQIPLHVWLPESMEGPTPISALIHAATMVTAGVYLVVRLAPLFVASQVALNFILIIGASTAFLMGLVALVQTDIKRIVAYSTLSQLGYMMAACGAGTFSGAIFHLITHAFFKALLFLSAGSVILALHHEQDIRKMTSLRWSQLPVTYVCFLVGTLALVAFPPFSGFYSKDIIIDAVADSTLQAAPYAYFCLVSSVLITACYSFRAFFLIFHARRSTPVEVKESNLVRISLLALAIPSFCSGFLLARETPPVISFLTVLMLAGIFIAWCCYIKFPNWPERFVHYGHGFYRILIAKFGFDEFNQLFFVRGWVGLSKLFFKVDTQILDEKLVNGSGRTINWFSENFRKLQSGFIYQYAFAMTFGLLLLLFVMVFGLWQMLIPILSNGVGPVYLPL